MLALCRCCLRLSPALKRLPAADAAAVDGGGGDVGDVADVLAMYCKISLDASVLPAPDSPDINTHWSAWSRNIDR